MRALSTREVLGRHRWAVGQMEGRTDHGPANLRLHDAVLGCLRAAGFSIEMTVHAYSVQDAYIYGFALQETDMSSRTPEDFAAEAQRQMDAYADMLSRLPPPREVVGGYVAEVRLRLRHGVPVRPRPHPRRPRQAAGLTPPALSTSNLYRNRGPHEALTDPA